jgi:hypothetical protein
MYSRSIAAEDSCALEREMFLISFINLSFLTRKDRVFVFNWSALDELPVRKP